MMYPWGPLSFKIVDGYACVCSSKSHVATIPARQGVAASHASRHSA
jgi:hypothetical protein